MILNFHLINILKQFCKKASNKLGAVARLISYMTIENNYSLKFFFPYSINYCAVVWMFHSHKNNSKINSVHEMCLRLIYSNKRSSYEKLLEKDLVEQFFFTTRILRYLQQKYTKSKIIYHLRFSVIYFVKQK